MLRSVTRPASQRHQVVSLFGRQALAVGSSHQQHFGRFASAIASSDALHVAYASTPCTPMRIGGHADLSSSANASSANHGPVRRPQPNVRPRATPFICTFLEPRHRIETARDLKLRPSLTPDVARTHADEFLSVEL